MEDLLSMLLMVINSSDSCAAAGTKVGIVRIKIELKLVAL